MVADVENVKARLRAAFNDISLQTTDSDGQFYEEFEDKLNHLCAASEPFLTRRQAMIVALHFGPRRMTQDEIADRLRWSLRTVQNDYSNALKLIAERVRD